MFCVNVLGVASAIPLQRRHLPAQVVKYNSNLFLVDAGDGTLVQLLHNNFSLLKIKQILISHIHGDHVLGVPAIISSMGLLGRETPLQIVAPPEVKTFVINTNKTLKINLPFEINFIELVEPTQKVYEDRFIEITTFPLKHRAETWGFLFKEKLKPRKLLIEKLREYDMPPEYYGRIKREETVVLPDGTILNPDDFLGERKHSYSYAYCCDTAYYPEVIEYIQGVDVLFHEATFYEAHREKANITLHSTAKDAAQIAKQANAKLLILGHFSGRYTRKELNILLSEAQEVFPNTILAKEGEEFHIKDLLQEYEKV